MFWLSSLLIFGCLGWFALAAAGSGAPLGLDQWIHARIPWVVLGLLWAGAGLTVVSLARKRTWARWGVVAVQALAVGFLSFYFLQASLLPEQPLALKIGQAFPSYALSDQDGRLQRFDAGSPREPALYIFFRGDW